MADDLDASIEQLDQAIKACEQRIKTRRRVLWAHVAGAVAFALGCLVSALVVPLLGG